MTDQPVAIITGAGSGVGEQIAIQLDAQGYHCVLVGRTKEKLENVSKRLSTTPLVISADVGVDEDRARIVEETLEQFGRIDALVNSAGVAIFKPMHQQDEESLDTLFRVNGIGPVDLARRVLPTMAKAKSGVVVSIASMANIDPFPGLGLYGCAKGALSVLPKAIENEYAKKGIRAYSICPGAIETDMLRGMFSKDALPENATLDPSDVAKRAVECVTNACDEASGSVIPMPSH